MSEKTHQKFEIAQLGYGLDVVIRLDEEIKYGTVQAMINPNLAKWLKNNHKEIPFQ